MILDHYVTWLRAAETLCGIPTTTPGLWLRITANADKPLPPGHTMCLACATALAATP